MKLHLARTGLKDGGQKGQLIIAADINEGLFHSGQEMV